MLLGATESSRVTGSNGAIGSSGIKFVSLRTIEGGEGIVSLSIFI
jgi:hypothetical protein